MVVGVIIVSVYLAILNYHRMSNIVKIVQQTSQEIRERVSPCRLEFEDDVIYMYRRDDAMFLGKAKTLKELEQELIKRFPEKLFDVNSEEIVEAKLISRLNERKDNVCSS